MFELECNRGSCDFTLEAEHTLDDEKEKEKEKGNSPQPGTKNILLKGQMKYIKDINAIIYLCSPM